MGESRLEIKVGSISFSGEGEGSWLSEQLDKMLSKIPELLAVAPAESTEKSLGGNNGGNQLGNNLGNGQTSGTLATYLKNTGSTTNQIRKFLATSVWLHDTQKKTRLTTTEVTAALRSSNQSRLGNPSDALAKNITKGFCDKDGEGFYVTPEGRESLGK